MPPSGSNEVMHRIICIDAKIKNQTGQLPVHYSGTLDEHSIPVRNVETFEKVRPLSKWEIPDFLTREEKLFLYELLSYNARQGWFIRIILQMNSSSRYKKESNSVTRCCYGVATFFICKITHRHSTVARWLVARERSIWADVNEAGHWLLRVGYSPIERVGLS